jgi:hypothetical protein
MAFMVFVRESTETAEDEQGILGIEHAVWPNEADKVDKGSGAPDCGELNRKRSMKAEKQAVYLGTACKQRVLFEFATTGTAVWRAERRARWDLIHVDDS